MSSQAPSTDSWDRALRRVRRLGKIPIAFGGPVSGGVLTLTQFSGTTTGHLDGLSVRSGSGVGGRAAAGEHMVAVDDYRSAETISHEYDRPVLAEGILSTAAVPVLVGGQSRGVLYAAVRERAVLGDRMEDVLSEAAAQLAAELTSWDLVERRASVLAAQHLAGDDHLRAGEQMRAAHAELRALIATVGDPSVVARLREVSRLLQPDSASAAPFRLTPRELDVLSLVAVGHTYVDVAGRLNLTPQTVKTYMRDITARLGARGRHEAVVIARRAGLLL